MTGLDRVAIETTGTMNNICILLSTNQSMAITICNGHRLKDVHAGLY